MWYGTPDHFVGRQVACARRDLKFAMVLVVTKPKYATSNVEKQLAAMGPFLHHHHYQPPPPPPQLTITTTGTSKAVVRESQTTRSRGRRRVAISTAPDLSGSGRVDMITLPGKFGTLPDSQRGEFNSARMKPHQTLVGNRRSESSSDIDRQNQRSRHELNGARSLGAPTHPRVTVSTRRPVICGEGLPGV